MKGNLGIIMTVHGRPDMARRALLGIERNVDAPFQLIVIDDNSDAFTRDYLKGWLKSWRSDCANPVHVGPPMLIRNDETLGMAASINKGVSRLGADDDVLVIHSDTTICGPGISRMREMLHEEKIYGIASALSNDPSGVNCVNMRRGSGAFHTASMLLELNLEPVLDYFSPKFHFMLIKRTMWDEVGPINADKYVHGYGADVNFWLEGIEKGWRSILCPWMWVHHVAAASNGLAARMEHGKNATTRIAFENRKYITAGEQWRSRRVIEKINSDLSRWHGVESAKRYQTVFVVAEIIHLGGVHVLLRLCDELILSGVDATVLSLNPMSATEEDICHGHLFEPYRNINPQTAYMAMPRYFKNGTAIAGTMGCSFWARHYSEENSGVKPMVYCQGDELRLKQDYWDEYNGEMTEIQAGKVLEEKKRMAESYQHGIPCVAVSKMAHDVFVKYSGGQRPVETISAAVDSLMFHSADSRPGLSVLGFARREKCRGSDILMRLYESLREKYGADIRLVVIGDASWGQHIGVEAHFRMNPESVAALMRTVRVVVDASRYQGFGLPCLEAMASGAVAVSFSNGGIEEYGVGDVNSLISPSGNEASLLANVITALEGDSLEMIGKGRQTAEVFNWGYASAAWMTFLDGLNQSVAAEG